MSIICLRSGMMNAPPRTAPVMQASVMSQKFELGEPPVTRGMPMRKSTGTVKMTPELGVFTADPTVCPMLTSRMVPLRSTPLRTPKPRTAAMEEPTIVKPIFRPE